MRSYLFNRILLLTLFLSVNSAVYGKKVGVVLSGGGAKGLYHIGIIKALEENNIPIDYIAGTSMGSIIGAMYASGFTPEQMLEIFRSGKVTTWLSGEIEEEYFYQKSDPDGSLFSFNVDFKALLAKGGDEDEKKSVIDQIEQGGLISPSLISSNQLELAMMDYFAPSTAAARNNFDSLFVPFRCVSVDILKRKEFVWKQGNLSKAVRASMSIPMVFAPVVVDSMLMYDGGILNNYPWQEMKSEFEPDFIVGGICLEQEQDISTIAGQISLLTTSKTDYNMPDSLGVQIKRDVNVGILDFDKVDYAVNLGYEDAMKMMPKIKESVSRTVSSEELNQRRLKFKSRVPTLMIDDVKILGVDSKQREYVEGQFENEDGSPITFEEFKIRFLKIVSSQMLKSSMAIARYNPETGYYRVVMKMSVNEGFRTLVGVSISSSNINEVYLGLQYTNIGRIGSIYKVDGYLGNYYSTLNLSSRFNFYDRSAPFYSESNINYTFQDFGRGNNQRRSYNSGGYDFSRLNGLYANQIIGVPLGKDTKIEGSINAGIDRYKYENNQNQSSDSWLDMNYLSVGMAMRQNTLNYKGYPTDGFKQSLKGMLVYDKTTYSSHILAGTESTSLSRITDVWFGASFSRDHYIPFSKVFTLGYSFQTVYTTMSLPSNSYAAALISPGFYPTEHSKTLFIPQFHSTSFAAVGLKPIINWNKNIYLKCEGYLYYSDLDNFKNSAERLRFMATSSLVYQSPLGPVSFNYSYYDVDGFVKNYYTFNLGITIFKNRGVDFF